MCKELTRGQPARYCLRWGYRRESRGKTRQNALLVTGRRKEKEGKQEKACRLVVVAGGASYFGTRQVHGLGFWCEGPGQQQPRPLQPLLPWALGPWQPKFWAEQKGSGHTRHALPRPLHDKNTLSGEREWTLGIKNGKTTCHRPGSLVTFAALAPPF